MAGPARLRKVHSVEEIHDIARRRLPRTVHDFIEGGAEDELTIGRNRKALQDLRFAPRTLVDVSTRSQETTLLGTPVSSPIVLAPVGLAGLAHPSGEVAAARAASAMGVISTLSSSASWSLEDVAGSSTGPKWFQLYIWRDRDLTRQVIERARAAGYLALCVTVDVPVSARRQRDLRNGFVIPP
ncbi:MAG: alpha-hydroxy-acid oxidizing protein, partial [Actinobacteria bacterium]|nr:alpha-hydroxy-acid oxidizing protein [Actinomycetota bacterium]